MVVDMVLNKGGYEKVAVVVALKTRESRLVPPLDQETQAHVYTSGYTCIYVTSGYTFIYVTCGYTFIYATFVKHNVMYDKWL